MLTPLWMVKIRIYTEVGNYFFKATEKVSAGPRANCWHCHYSNFITGAIASQITSLMIVYSTVYPGVNQRKHQNSASLAFVRGIHRWPVNSPHKWLVPRKMFSLDDVIMVQLAADEESRNISLATQLPPEHQRRQQTTPTDGDYRCYTSHDCNNIFHSHRMCMILCNQDHNVDRWYPLAQVSGKKYINIDP